MSTKKCVVVRVDVPTIAHEPGTFATTVIYAQKIWIRQNVGQTPIQGVDYLIKKHKRGVFTQYRPVIGASIECQFL
jgi:hypothetical protein